MWTAPAPEAGADGEPEEPSVAKGEVLLKLRGVKGIERKVARLEKEATKLQDRADRLQASGKAAQIQAAEARAAKKGTELRDAKESMSAFLITSPKAGAFTPTVKPKDKVEAGVVVGMVAGLPVRTATFQIKDSSGFAVDAPANVAAKADPATVKSCTVTDVAEGSVTVDCGAELEAGPVILVPAGK